MLVIAVTISIFFGQAAIVNSSQQDAIINVSVLNIRSGPGTQHSVVDHVTKGERLPILEQSGDWYRVSMENGKEGWIADWLVETEAAEITASGIATVNGTIVNVRSGPGISYEQIDRVHKDQEVTLLAKKEDWYKISLADGKSGWIAGWLLDVSEEESTEAGNSDGSKSQMPKKEVTITASNVNIRSGPATTYTRITQVNQGTAFTWLGEENAWLQVKLSDGKPGWVAGWLAEVKEIPGETIVVDSKKPEQPEEQTVIGRTAVVDRPVVNIRSGPGTSFERLTTVSAGQGFPILNHQNDWYQLDLGLAGEGWIAGWLVNLRNTTTVVARGDSGEERLHDDSEDKQEKSEDKNEELDSDEKEIEIPEHLNLIDNIDVNATGNGTQVKITATDEIVFSTHSVRNPNRVVVDINDAFLTYKRNSDWNFGNSPIQNIRYSQYDQEEVRIVIDLSEAVAYETVLSGDKKTLSINLASSAVAGRLIVIDPGHGTINPRGISDPGAVGPTGLFERDVATDISHRLKAELEKRGAQVVLTRTGPTTNLNLAARAQVANDLNADIFVSIHANASLSSRQNGTSVWYYGPPRSDLGSQRADRQFLARAIQDEMVRETGLRDMGIFEENFSVLRNTRMPSVLVETAFISNPHEERLLATPAFRQRTAEAVARGIAQYFAQN